MDKVIIHNVYPFPVPEIGSGLELGNYLKEFIQEKDGKQKINGWFLFCFDCENELATRSKPDELWKPYEKEVFSLLEKIEKAGIKLSV